MKIAYLILCHKNSHQIERLIKQLNTQNTDFYLHIDKKATNVKLMPRDNVYYVEDKERVDVRWATISMVYATMALVKKALNTNIKYDYYFLISGQDFPIKSNEYIESFLIENKGKNFIQVLSHSDPMYTRYKKRNVLYYPEWMFSQKTIVKILRKIYILISGGYKKTFKVFRRKLAANITFEYGSQWWGLERKCLVWIYNYLKKNNNLNKIFGYSLTPDECVFQTVFMMSPFNGTQRDKLVYLEWSKNRNNPKVLTKADFNLLLDDKKNLFARKFDESVDSEIIDCMEKFTNNSIVN